ncbi:MAG: PEP-CTERM sorting domain-containing protein [Candidatus Korobacteraceae bacterium]
MTKQSLWRVALVVAVCLSAVSMASAGSSIQPFPAAGDQYCSASNGCGTIPAGGQSDFLWTTGDFVESAVFTIPGSLGVIGISTNFSYQDFLGNGNTETWLIYLNGVQVGSGVLPDDGYNGDIFKLITSNNFSAIAPVAGGYQLELVLQNTVPFGGGSVAWLDGGTAELDFIPEPGVLALLGSGLVTFGGLYYRKIRTTQHSRA